MEDATVISIPQRCTRTAKGVLELIEKTANELSGGATALMLLAVQI
jgi:hypothetical protein